MKNDNIKSMKLYAFLIPFVLGAFLTVFVYQAFTIYQLRSIVADDHANLTQVVNFLNTQIQAAQGQQGTTKPQTGTGTSTKK